MKLKLFIMTFLLLLLAGCSMPVEIVQDDETGQRVLRVAGELRKDEPTATLTDTPGPPSPFPTPTPDTRPRHVIQSGDSLWAISASYGVSIDEIKTANRMYGGVALLPGTELIIPIPTPTPTPRPPTETPTPTPLDPNITPPPTLTPTPTATPDLRVLHTVQSGDTLWTIAALNDITVDELIAANANTYNNRLTAGMVLLVPVTASPTPTPETRTPTPTATPTTRPTATPTPILFTPPPLASPKNLVEWPHYLAELINERRSAHGLEPLAWSPILAQAAQTHADDCARRGSCSHTSSDGAQLRERLARVGYDPDWASENWAYARYPELALTWWYTEAGSPAPNRKNLLSTDYLEIGIGAARDQWGMVYFVADFGATEQKE